uniref:universal stress protein n=1 Tax=Alteromonas sp. a30 TaxID=2730917 RepID=UPI00228037A9|nr:universal stress protein [Alteromonas sp. a30]MCY7297233.1 universal stress protein [Alteromonas sp. a30]
MYNHIWFFDAQHPVSDVVLNKQIRLAKAFNSQVCVVIDQRARATERRFWQSASFFEAASKAHIEQVQNLQLQLEKALTQHQINYRMFISDQKLYRQTIERALSENAENMILLMQKPKASQHAIYQDLASLPCSVFMLTEKPWSATVKMTAAIDPLHEHARPEALDNRIVRSTQDFEKKLNAQWWLVHCCYISPMFLEYKQAIKDIHAEGFEQFAEENRIAPARLKMLTGMPESALPAWVDKQKVDVLVLGMVARNALMAHLVGSTTTALLSQQPCDMLMVTQA